MIIDLDRILAELPLPLGGKADVLEALGIAVAIEDVCGVTLPDDVLDVAHLGRVETTRTVLSDLLEQA